MVLFLFSHLALHLLRPTPQDFERLHSWLLHFGPDTIQSQVARLVLAKLNWGVDEEVSVSCPFKSISTRDLMCVPGCPFKQFRYSLVAFWNGKVCGGQRYMYAS